MDRSGYSFYMLDKHGKENLETLHATLHSKLSYCVTPRHSVRPHCSALHYTALNLAL
jgi:hypothetical protein